MFQSTGSLYIVSTPIGNLGDLSPRAAKTLESVKYILCESVQQTLKLTVATQVRGTSLIRYEGKGPKSDWQIQKVIADLQNGDSVALVSNAGTPLISDPGAKLVSAVVRAGLPVIHVPGPAAFVSASGLPTKNILFIGFLPKKTNALAQKLAAARSSLLTLDEPASLVCYVSKYQLNKIMAAVTEVFGGQIIVNIARELTKLHEDHFTGPISELKPWLSASPHRSKGEFTLVISPS